MVLSKILFGKISEPDAYAVMGQTLSRSKERI